MIKDNSLILQTKKKMQIAKKILLHLFIICILVVVNLYTVNETVNEEEIPDFDSGQVEVVESVVQSTPYGLELSEKRSPLGENSCAAVEPLDLKESQVKGRNTSAPMVIMKDEYSDLIDLLSSFQFDTILGDSTVAQNRSNFQAFCGGCFQGKRGSKYLGYNYHAFVMDVSKEREEASTWTFVKPFTPGMWWATAAIMIYTSLVVWLLEQKTNPLIYTEMSITEVFLIIWSAVSTMSLSQNVRIESRSARIVIAVWFLVMSIVVFSYSSNFTSMLNAQKTNPTMPETPNRLGVKDFLGWFIITGMVSTMALLIFFFNLLYASGATNVTGQGTDDDLEELSSTEGGTVQAVGISNNSEAEENTLVEASSVFIPHIANESRSMEDQNV